MDILYINSVDFSIANKPMVFRPIDLKKKKTFYFSSFFFGKSHEKDSMVF